MADICIESPFCPTAAITPVGPANNRYWQADAGLENICREICLVTVVPLKESRMPGNESRR